MSWVKQQQFALQEALAICFAAQRINGSYVKHTQRFSTEGNPTIHANKDMVKQHFGRYTEVDFVNFKAQPYRSKYCCNKAL